MTEVRISLEDIATLNALANGIIPPDETDGGAAMVFAGLGAADKFRQGVNAEVYAAGYSAFDNASPWGGFKQSGWGREKGPYGLDLFTQIKSVVINYT